ncbi:DUF5123 domain-containing protein [Sphingobacterium sp. LRF_L2]|uniref:DUF5123 domain-containing protein n=1 Tax=Sphingobacterium sp. LRF_L2 TaxID=3369421 RepID=UPI003F646015
MRNLLRYLAFICFLINFSSCEKAIGPDMNYYIASPENITLEAVQKSLEVSWDYTGIEQVGFLAEVSYVSTFATVVQSDTLGADVRGITFENLGYFAEAYVRVKALSSNLVLHSSFVQASIVPESILKTILKSELTATSAILRWDNPSSGTLTSVLVIDNINNTEREIILSATNLSEQSLLIEDLESAGNYTVVIFAGEDRKGVLTFNAVDLNAAISIEGQTDVYETLQDAVDAAESGDVINIGGAKYDFSSTALETLTIIGKSLTFRANPESESVPEITIKNFWLKGAIASIKLSGLKILSTSKANTNATNVDYNKHLLGISYVTGNIDVTVEDCDISGVESGLIFTQSASSTNLPEGALTPATISLTVTNCLLHDSGNAGGDYIDFRSGAVGNIVYKNNTFWNGARAFLRMDATATWVSGSTISIENSTFYNFCNGGIFLRNAITTGVSFVMNNNIVMNKVSNNGNSIGTNGTLKLSNNNISGTNAANITNGVTSGFNIGTTALDPEFTSASTGDFTVGNATVRVALQGDPRWLK